MRVLHLISSVDGGGAERQLVYLCEGLARLGHSVHVGYLLDGVHESRLRAAGAHLHRLGWRHALDPSLVGTLCRLVLQTRADVVQTWLRRMDVAGGLAAVLTRRPWIYSERSTWQGDGAEAFGWRQKLRHRLAAGAAAAVVANSHGGAAPWRPEAGARVHVVANALPLDEIAAVAPASRRSLGIAEDAELILWVGRFSVEKNLDVLGEALAEVLVKRPRAVALLCGKGDRLASFRALVDARGVGQRCLTPGFRADVLSLLKACDVLIAASRYEGRPNAVLEAMACRAPLVLSDIPAHREVASEDEALYFAVDDARSAAKAIERALDDRLGARERAEKAAARAGVLSPTEMARAYEGIYREAMGASRSL